LPSCQPYLRSRVAARPAQEGRHGLARPSLGARDLEAGHYEVADDGGGTPGAALAARASAVAPEAPDVLSILEASGDQGDVAVSASHLGLLSE
jgi:hypothetical protein